MPDGSYHEFLVGGFLVQTLAFGLMGPGVSIASDLREGMVDRLRTRPALAARAAGGRGARVNQARTAD